MTDKARAAAHYADQVSLIRLADENENLRADNARLREACELTAERLEAWAEAHHACAMHMPASEDVTVQQNIRDNYLAQVNRLRAALAGTKS